VDLGFADALVQKRDVEEAHRSSVFWTRLAIGALMASAMYALAPRIAGFYDVADVAGVARRLSPIFLLGASSTVARAIVERRLDFRTVVRIECTVAAVAGAVAVALAWRGFGVTTLVAHMLLWLALEDLLFLRASGWRPRLRWSARALGDLLGFGTNRMATRTLGYWSRHVDELLVGRILGVTSLGLYTRAFNLIQVPVLYVSRATHRALFPSLAEIQDDPERVRRTHLRTTGAVALATVPMCLGLAALAEPVVLGLFGPQWREMVPLVRILSVAGLLQSITSLSASLFLSQGRPDLQLRVIVLQSVTTIVAVLVGRRWGVTGVAVAYVLAFVVASGPTIHIAGRLVGLTVADVVAHVRSALAAGIVMAATVVLVDAWVLDGAAPLVRLAVGVPLGVGVYAALIRIGRVHAYQDVADVIRRSAA
jgi:PST family polysaccharide transporter